MSTMTVRLGSSRLELVQGDITQQQVDALVNAANMQLAGGGGVDGAIHKAGGPEIMAACRTLGGCPTGDAVATTAGRLPAKRVIHAVAPRWRGGKHGEPAQLASAYRNAFRVAAEEGMKSIAVPSLGTGAYGYPVTDAARIAVGAAMEFLGRAPGESLIRFVLFDRDTYDAFREQLEEQAPTQALPAID